MDRTPTGIPGFDTLVEGGLPTGSTTLLTGVPGTGKSIFALEYIKNGIEKGENGIYIYTESSTESLRKQAQALGLDFDKEEAAGRVALINVPLEKKKFDIFYAIGEKAKAINAKRVVFDSLATFVINLNLFTIPQAYEGSAASGVEIETTEGSGSKHKTYFKSSPEKRMIYIIMETLRELGTTNLVITFGGQKETRITVDGISEYIADGIIAFYEELIGSKRARTMSILKMRNTAHSLYINDFEISEKGIAIKPAEQVYK